MKRNIATTAAARRRAKRPKAAAIEMALAIAPIANGARTRGIEVQSATVESAAEWENGERRTASAKLQGTTAPAPKPTTAKPTTLAAKPRSAATMTKPTAATHNETMISRRSPKTRRGRSAKMRRNA